MKTIFTLFASLLLSLSFTNQAYSQNCGNTNLAVAFPTPITIDGNMSDWTAYLAQLGNTVNDNTLGIDLDAPIQNPGRDLVKFAFTEDAQNLYFFLERASTINNGDIVC